MISTMRIIKELIWKFLTVLKIAGVLQIMWKGKYLDSKGWFRSFYNKQSVDKNGNPIPWCSYPFIAFIQERLSKEMDVFEFGCGNSTHWYASKVRSIKSVEHDLKWIEMLRQQLPTNASVVYKELVRNGDYSREVMLDQLKYHVIIIDGRDRENCVKNSISCLTADGVIVFDNSQLLEYRNAIDFLKDQGFKRIDFYGLLPIVAHENCTTIFYRSNNCLGI